MKALYLAGKKRFKLADVPAPSISRPDEVMVRIKSVGLCGSDIHYYLHGSTAKEKSKFPFIIGHECAGEVAAAGSKARSFKPGDKVFVEPNVACFDCDMCASGNYNYCRNQKFMGYPGQMEGAMREFCVMPSANLIRFGNGLTFDEALMAEPLSIALYSLSLSRRLAPRAVAVLGAGSIGLCLIKALKILHERTAVYATDIIDERLALGIRNGAKRGFNPKSMKIVEEFRSATDSKGVDAVFECAGVPQTVDQALEILKPGGTLFLIGIPEKPSVRFDADLFRKKGLTVTYIRRQNRQALKALRMLEARILDVRDIIGPVFDLEDAAAAFAAKVNKPETTVKPIIRI